MDQLRARLTLAALTLLAGTLAACSDVEVDGGGEGDGDDTTTGGTDQETSIVTMTSPSTGLETYTSMMTGPNTGVTPPGAYDCAYELVGTCCKYDHCYTKAEAEAMFGATDDVCPVIPEDELGNGSPGACSWWQSAQPTVEDGLCCYVKKSGTCCGRPFLVEGAAVVAPTACRSDWMVASHRPRSLGPMSEATRRELARQWLDDARMEHASVAAFARFTLQLLACGAPADLVAASQAASLDEVEHARACFALAARYSGQDVGPGALAIDGALDGDAIEMIATLVEEGCVGETVAAQIAAHAALSARDPQAREALDAIARDEENHAVLAWKALGWLLRTRGPSAWDAAQRGLARSRAAGSAPAPWGDAVDVDVMADHGRLPPHEHAVLRGRVLAEIVLPAMETLGHHVLRPTDEPRQGALDDHSRMA